MKNEVHIGIFGKRNQGKSSLINLLTGQQAAIVSDCPGTTTDPVKKSCEIFGIGKCVLTDTAGFDDNGPLGLRRTEKTRETVRRMDAGILVVSENTFTEEDKVFADLLKKEDIPFLILHNKADRTPLSAGFGAMLRKLYPDCSLLDFSVHDALQAREKMTAGPAYSALEQPDGPQGTIQPRMTEPMEADPAQPITDRLRKMIADSGTIRPTGPVLEGLVQAGDRVILVCPIDAEAPENRLILPQVMISRQCLDMHAVPVLCQPEELSEVAVSMNQPALVITDSQVFARVAALIPEHWALTSFSICLARQKGNFELYLEGTQKLASLEDGQEILMLESCTHQVNCHDIGRVKLPAALRKASGKALKFRFVSGLDALPDDLSGFAMAIQCGGCMVTARQLDSRIRCLREAGIPVSNYGMALAWAGGIFERATGMFG